jgi:glycosyltransferase involved in cell wall biosynthesis
VSEELREIVLRLGAAPAKIETFTLGIDTGLFPFHEPNRSWSSRRPIRLVCTRRFEPVYDHRTILQSIADLKRKGVDCELTLVGDGILRPSLEAQARKLELAGRVTFAGTVPNQALPDRLAGHDVYLSASTRDGTSLCLLEAMAHGLYPVVSDIRGNREWIEHGHNGLLHKTSDPASLADCIASLAQLEEPPLTALRHNRALVVSKGDRTLNLTRLEGVYRRLSLRAAEAAGSRPGSLVGAVPPRA